MNYLKLIIVPALLLSASAAYAAPVETLKAFFSPQGQEVTKATYPRAESARQFLIVQSEVGVNSFLHRRELAPTDKQWVVGMNRDTYYSTAVVDISKGATLTLPKVPEGKYLSAMFITEDHRIQPMVYGAGTYKLTTHTGTHVYVVIRLDGTLPPAKAHRIQDMVKINANSAKAFSVEPVKKASFTKVETALKSQWPAVVKRDGGKAFYRCFTAPGDPSNKTFDQEKYEICSAVGWGGAQTIDNIYELSTNYQSKACHQATFEDPKNGAFWSFTVYNAENFLFNDVAHVSSKTAKPNADGSYTVSFGCGADAPNNIPTANKSGVFRLAARHYQPSDRVIKGYRLLPTVKMVK